MEHGKPAKQEITFGTKLFWSKTFLLYVEPVFNKSGDSYGVNYVGMDITDQVIKREKVAKLREQIEKYKKAELDKAGMLTTPRFSQKRKITLSEQPARRPYHISIICLNSYLFLS